MRLITLTWFRIAKNKKAATTMTATRPPGSFLMSDGVNRLIGIQSSETCSTETYETEQRSRLDLEDRQELRC